MVLAMTLTPQRQPFDELPESLLDMADHINKDAIMRLVAHYGGTRCYIPKVLPETSELAAVIGQDAARALAEVLGGERIEVPKARDFQRAVRNREIIRRHREEGLSYRELARAFDMTERNIGSILRTARGAAR